MRASSIILIPILILSPPALAGGAKLHWSTWNHLPVFDGGRAKPLDTLARETCRQLFDTEQIVDPDTGQTLDPTAAYLQMLFDWQGGVRPPMPQSAGRAAWRALYLRLHAPDKWDRAALLAVTHRPLREALGLPSDQRAVSPLDLSQAKITLAAANEPRPFLRWAEEVAAKPRTGLAVLERQALDLADRFWAYQEHRMGQRLELLPSPDASGRTWLSVATLWHTEFNDATDRTDNLRKVQTALRAAGIAYHGDDADGFNTAATSLLSRLREAAASDSGYPPRWTIALEVFYSHVLPFRWAWMLTAGACAVMAWELAKRRRAARVDGVLRTPPPPAVNFHAGVRSAYIGGLVAAAAGLAMRALILGRAPLADMFEVIIGVGTGVLALGWGFERFHRQGLILAVAAAIGGVPLVLADCTAWLDAGLRPLPVNLYYDHWLIGHVVALTLGGAALAVALGIGHLSLAKALIGAARPDADDPLTRLTNRGLQAGVLLLAAGAILGSVWAENARGTSWGADPREVWLLVALLTYLAALHAQAAGWVRGRGLAALAVVCFPTVVIAGYGLYGMLRGGEAGLM